MSETIVSLTRRCVRRGSVGFHGAGPCFELFEQYPSGAVVQGGRAEDGEVLEIRESHTAADPTHADQPAAAAVQVRGYTSAVSRLSAVGKFCTPLSHVRRLA
jgi:hypothetical protein